MKIRRRKLFGLILSLLLSMLLTGCATAPQTSQATEHSGIRVGFSHAEVLNPWRTAQISSFRQAMEAVGYEFVYTEPLEYSQSWQIKNIEKMLRYGVDFLFIVPMDVNGYRQVLSLANAKGTKIIALGQPLGGCISGRDYFSCIYYDYARAGKLCGETLTEAFQDDVCNIIEISSSNPMIAKEISDGFHGVIDDKYRCKVVCSIMADGDRVATQKLLEKAIIQLYQDGTRIQAVFAHNDEDGLAALNALKLAGFGVDEIKIVSINGEQDVFKAIIAKEYTATVTCSPIIGTVAYHTILLDAQGFRVPPNILIPCLLVDETNARISYQNAY